MSEKIIKTENIGDSLDVDLEPCWPLKPKLEINTLIKFLTEAKNKNATHVYFQSFGTDLDMQPTKEYLESDKEYKERLKNEETKRKEREEEALQGEISQYKHLRDKFKDLDIK